MKPYCKLRYILCLLSFLFFAESLKAQFSFLENHIQYSSDFQNQGDNVFDVIISKDNRHLYTISNAGDNIIHFYERMSDGKLNLVEIYKFDDLGPPIGVPMDVGFDPTEKIMYLISDNVYGIRVLARDEISGKLTFMKSYSDMDGSLSMEKLNGFTISDDGKNFFATSYHYIYNYMITANGDLSLIQTNIINENESVGINSSNRKIMVASDHFYIYSKNKGIAHYFRTANGFLEHKKNYMSGDLGDVFFSDSQTAGICPEGTYIFIAGDMIACIDISSDDGSLSFKYKKTNEEIGLDRRSEIESIDISQDGKRLVGIGNRGKILLSSSINMQNGLIKVEQIGRFSNEDVYALYNYPTVMYSADIRNFYIVSYYEGMLFAFKTRIPVKIQDNSSICFVTADLWVEHEEKASYSWSTSDTTQIITIDSIGVYNVTVTDSLGRIGTDSTTIEILAEQEFQLKIDSISLNDTIMALDPKVSGGTYPYTYLWNDSDTSRKLEIDVNELVNDTTIFYLKVLDSNNCEAKDSILLLIMDVFSEESIPADIKLFPNPTNSIVNIETNLNSIKNKNIVLTNHEGKKAASKLAITERGYCIDLSELAQGVYFVIVSVDGKAQSFPVVKLD